MLDWQGYQRRASIRPRLLARGDEVDLIYERSNIIASIRPRLLARGDQWCKLAPNPIVFASIRPRLLARGDQSAPPDSVVAITLQFGHACLRVETPHSPTPVGAKPLLQFGHACLRVETCPDCRVIGAVEIASIRPRLLARGDPSLTANDATTETASIRPRLLARGDAPPRHPALPSEPLQFGHACLRVETWRCKPRRYPSSRLQFGHACLRVETQSGDVGPAQ